MFFVGWSAGIFQYFVKMCHNYHVMQDIYQTFEFNKIKEMLNEYTKTTLAKKKVDALKMYSSSSEVNEALEDLKEKTSIIFRFGPLPIESSVDALEMIEMAKQAVYQVRMGVVRNHQFLSESTWAVN